MHEVMEVGEVILRGCVGATYRLGVVRCREKGWKRGRRLCSIFWESRWEDGPRTDLSCKEKMYLKMLEVTSLPHSICVQDDVETRCPL